MVSRCFEERGHCFLSLGRFDEATTAYEECIHVAQRVHNERQVAVGKVQIGTVRMAQHQYAEALAAYDEARDRFMQLDEPRAVAKIWHQTGMVREAVGQADLAEDAYRKSLSINVRLGDVYAQAHTLVQLGNLYDDVLGRSEEAAAFCRQAADKYVEIGDAICEGLARANLGDTLHKLGRLDEARQEIRRAIECMRPFGHAAEPWKTWAILADIETDAGDPTAAEAKRKAITCYLAYRRDGGENHDGPGRLIFGMGEKLRAGGPAAASSVLQQLAYSPEAVGPFRTYIRALQAIVAGSRDRTLADAPDLSYGMAAEILFLIETLEKKSQ
jgi:Tfp pilus assembly protein PilF